MLPDTSYETRDDAELLRDDSELDDTLDGVLLLRMLDELSDEEETLDDMLEDMLERELILDELLLALCASTAAAGINNERADRGMRNLRITAL